MRDRKLVVASIERKREFAFVLCLFVKNKIIIVMPNFDPGPHNKINQIKKESNEIAVY